MTTGSPYVLRHKRDFAREFTCATTRQLLDGYFYQWRDPDGSIPWDVFYEDRQVIELVHEGKSYRFC